MALQQWLDKNGVSVAEFAQRIGVSRQAVWGWTRGNFYPNALHLRQIELETNGQVVTAAFVEVADA